MITALQRDECPASVDVYRRKLAYLDQHIGELMEIRDRLAGRLAEITPPASPLSASPLSALGLTCRPFLEEKL